MESLFQAFHYVSAIVGLHIEEANTVGHIVRLSPYAVLIYLSFDLPLDLMPLYLQL